MKFYKAIEYVDFPFAKTVLTENELFTEKEISNWIKKFRLSYSVLKHFDIVNVSLKNTHWFFGSRFENRSV